MKAINNPRVSQLPPHCGPGSLAAGVMQTHSEGLTIRAARIEDAAAIAVLSAELGYSSNVEQTSDSLRAILASPADLVVVAEMGGRVIGWLQAHAAHILESGFRVEITGLIVSGAARRRGCGRKLVRCAEEWARSLSAPAIVVRSNIVRTESHEFCSALGYGTTKTQKVYRKALPDR